MSQRCICRFLQGIGSCVMGSLRLILFFGALLLFALSLLDVIFLFRLGDSGALNVLPIPSDWFKWFFAIDQFTLAIAAVGIYGSFYRSPTVLKTFSVLAFFNALLIVVFISCVTSAVRSSGANQEYWNKMLKYRSSYDWQKLPLEEVERRPTLAWDIVQSTKCCGVKGPHDWDQFRPQHLATKYYPRSCCKTSQRVDYDGVHYKDGLCVNKNSSLYYNGCLRRVEYYENRLLFTYNGFAGFQVFLICLASCICVQIGRERSSRTNERSSSAPAIRTNRAPELLYAFHKQTTNNDARLYPNLDHQTVASSRTPRYGTVE